MNALPRIVERPPRLGRKQVLIYDAVVSLAQDFDNSDPDLGLAPRRASVTMNNLIRMHPGIWEADWRPAIEALVRRGILKVSSVGWSLGDQEYERLLWQKARENEGSGE